jgi:7-cyano-7-deazaguanine synthase
MTDTPTPSDPVVPPDIEQLAEGGVPIAGRNRIPGRAVAIVSGGLDSTVLAYRLAADGHPLHMVSFDYGQRHARELEYAVTTAGKLDADHTIIELPQLAEALQGNALTGVVEVPEGHYAEDTMRQTVVPNRNMIMLAMAGSIAVAEGAIMVATGVHAGDHFVYPDCRPQFIQAVATALVLGNEGFAHEDLRVFAPFVNSPKDVIVSIGDQLGVPWLDTWSCYVGGERHCGRCGTCVERAEAFHLAGVDDPTDYADADYWRGAVANRAG